MTDFRELLARAADGDAAAQYALSAAYDRAGDSPNADIWLERAASLRHPGALYTLATRRLGATADERIAADIAKSLGAAADAGSGAAMRLLAVMTALGLGVEEDWRRAVMLLSRSAALGRPDALRELGVLALTFGGPQARARSALNSAAAGGDAIARALAQSGAAGAADKDAIERLATACTDLGPRPVAEETVRDRNPLIRRFKAALTPLECAYIRAAAAGVLAPTAVVDPELAAARHAEFRTSDGGTFDLLSLDLVLIALWRRLSEMAGRRAPRSELLQALRYKPGQEYRPHHDYLPEDAADYSQVKRCGQREATLLVSLSEDYGGGETTFPRLSLAFRGRTGDALFFENTDPSGRPIPESLHAGAPVISGEKWMLTLWFRQRRFWYWGRDV